MLAAERGEQSTVTKVWLWLKGQFAAFLARLGWGAIAAEQAPDKPPATGSQARPDDLSDRPLEDPAHDRLGRSRLAQALARSILDIGQPEGFVFGICAPWGTGKSTLLNFILYHVAEQDTEDSVVVVRFDPWWYSGDQDLLLHFFDELRAALGKRGVPEDLRSLGGKLQTFAKLISPFRYLPVVGEWAQPIHRGLTASGESLRAAGEELQKDAHGIRQDINAVLRRQSKRILVVIDDLDRLSSAEICQMFRLIKAVADFPQTMYLLAFDPEIVAEAVAEVQKGRGEDYLEKIVQARFDIPLPDRKDLRGMLLERLDRVIGKPDPALWDVRTWSNVFLEGIDPFIATPRDVTRYVNALRVSYPAVKGEVNPIDFLAVECLRVFANKLYCELRAAKDLFVESIDSWATGREGADDREKYTAFLEQCDPAHRTPAKALLARTFPRVATAFREGPYKTHDTGEWRKGLLVCSPDLFDIYFQFAVPSGSISLAHMRSILILTSDSDAFGAALLELSKQKGVDGRTSKARAALERLEDYTRDEIPVDDVGTIISALYDVGDRLMLWDDEGGMFRFGNDLQLLRIVFQLVCRIPDEQERGRLLHGIIADCRSLYLVVYSVALWRDEHESGAEREPPREQFSVPADALPELQDVALARITAAAADGSLAKTPRLAFTLYRWRDWTDITVPSRFAARLQQGDEGLVDLLVGFLSPQWSQSGPDVVARLTWRVRPKSLAEFGVDLDEAYRRAKAILQSSPPWLDETGRQALEPFIDECEHPDNYRD